jgi:putative oxidoreductase
MNIAKKIVLWAITLFLVYGFLKAGIRKFSDTSGWAQAFRLWGYPVWFRILVGVVEVSAALLLLYKRTAAVGASLIIVVMLGAMGTHIFVEHRAGQVANEVLPLILAIAVLLLRRGQGASASGTGR